MDITEIKHWQTMSFRDTDAMGAWLAAIGFHEHATYRDEADPSVVVHGEWVWDGGGIMGGTDSEGSPITPPGQAACYLVVEDTNLGIQTGDELRAELQAGLTRDASDLNPLRVFGTRK